MKLVRRTSKEMNAVIKEKVAKAKQERDIEWVNKIEEIFSEGFFSYFYTAYSSDDDNLNEQMIQEISSRLEKLKEVEDAKCR